MMKQTKIILAVLTLASLQVFGGEESSDRKWQALVCIVDIPMDIGVVYENGFDRDEVQAAICELQKFSVDEIEWAINRYFARRSFESIESMQAKCFLIMHYCYAIPDDFVFEERHLKGNTTYFGAKVRPWRRQEDGARVLVIRGLASQQVSGTGFNGPMAFRTFRREFSKFQVLRSKGR